ncbi:RICIN domain-containing protein [Streptomyces sp. XH2]|uniref:RICIN domain-containing protein n=1 Tax=Streptomyces sp. XH2 TaxID=3412483 RepID=UPI003C7C1790
MAGLKGAYTVINAHSGKVLDVAGASKDEGANVHQWDANGTDAQIWDVTEIGEGSECYPACPVQRQGAGRGRREQ